MSQFYIKFSQEASKKILQKKYIRLHISGALIIILLNTLSYAKAESIKQCFPLNNFPGRLIQNFWIQKAELKEKDIHKKLANRLSGALFSTIREKNISVLLQEITNGKGSVFVFRERFSGWSGLTDTSTLQYLTVYIPGDLVKNREIDLSKEDEVLAVLTEGVPSFKNFCFGYAKKGKIDIMVSNGYDNELMNKMSQPIFYAIGEDAVIMNIDIMVTTKNTNEAWQEQCGVCVLQANFVFFNSSLNELIKN